MGKYQPHSRRRLKTLFRKWFRANRLLFSALIGGATLLIAFETWMLSTMDLGSATRSYLIGALQVGVVAVLIGALVLSFLAQEGEAIWQVRGAWGEDFTRDELNRARRKKLIWGWTDSVTVQSGDIDHFVVTRSGGLIAIDSKWRGRHDLDPASMAREANRARVRAEGVVQTILQKERGSHRAPIKSVRVRPLVVVWGPARDEVPDNAVVDGVAFVGGRQLVTWLKNCAGESVDEPAGADILAELEAFRASRWDSSRSS